MPSDEALKRMNIDPEGQEAEHIFAREAAVELAEQTLYDTQLVGGPRAIIDAARDGITGPGGVWPRTIDLYKRLMESKDPAWVRARERESDPLYGSEEGDQYGKIEVEILAEELANRATAIIDAQFGLARQRGKEGERLAPEDIPLEEALARVQADPENPERVPGKTVVAQFEETVHKLIEDAGSATVKSVRKALPDEIRDSYEGEKLTSAMEKMHNQGRVSRRKVPREGVGDEKNLPWTYESMEDLGSRGADVVAYGAVRGELVLSNAERVPFTYGLMEAEKAIAAYTRNRTPNERFPNEIHDTNYAQNDTGWASHRGDRSDSRILSSDKQFSGGHDWTGGSCTKRNSFWWDQACHSSAEDRANAKGPEEDEDGSDCQG